METKPLLFGLIGFIVGGLLVSVAATTFDAPQITKDTMAMSEMTNSLRPLNGDAFDEAFIINMIHHHEGAVDMAKFAEKQAEHQEIKDISARIILAQQNEIEMMQKWQRDWGYETTNTEHVGH